VVRERNQESPSTRRLWAEADEQLFSLWGQLSRRPPERNLLPSSLPQEGAGLTARSRNNPLPRPLLGLSGAANRHLRSHGGAGSKWKAAAVSQIPAVASHTSLVPNTVAQGHQAGFGQRSTSRAVFPRIHSLSVSESWSAQRRQNSDSA